MLTDYDRTYREEPIWQYDGTGAYDPSRYNYLDLAERSGSRSGLSRTSSVLPPAMARGRQPMYDDMLPPFRGRDSYYHDDSSYHDDPYYHQGSSYSDRDYNYPRSRSSHHRSSYYDDVRPPVPAAYAGGVIPAPVVVPSTAIGGSSVMPMGYAADAPYTIELRVPICCEGCERRIVKKLLEVPGVMTVRCDIERQKVSVRGVADTDSVLRASRRAFPQSRMWM